MLFTRLVIAAPALAFLAACSDATSPTEVGRVAHVNAKLDIDQGPDHAGAIVAHDACDPLTFNAQFGDGTCVKQGHVTLDNFLSQVENTHVANGWNFSPNQLTARLGVDLLGNNIGGETHTFTPVKAFGGGFFEPLNVLSGNLVPAEECLTLDLSEDLVAAGAKYTIEKEELAEVVDASGIARVQCCIHPWMRATVRMQHGVIGSSAISHQPSAISHQPSAQTARAFSLSELMADGRCLLHHERTHHPVSEVRLPILRIRHEADQAVFTRR